jgi:hypothetical protein
MLAQLSPRRAGFFVKICRQIPELNLWVLFVQKRLHSPRKVPRLAVFPLGMTSGQNDLEIEPLPRTESLPDQGGLSCYNQKLPVAYLHRHT